MKRFQWLLFVVLVGWLLASWADAAEGSRFEQVPDVGGGLELFVWRDTCNVYVLRQGESALLVDVGDGSVLDHLGELGVRRLEWVLLTHHHREQCQGHPKLKAWQPQIAAPAKEQALLERPAEFRKLKPSLGDAFSVHGASYVRPPVEPLVIQRAFKTMDTFTWHDREFWCLETAGNSPGSMSYLLRTDQGWLAYSGAVMVLNDATDPNRPAGGATAAPPLASEDVAQPGRGRMHTWFDTEWDYGFAKGLYTLIESVSLLESFEPAWLLPSHGPAVRQPQAELHAYQQRLRKLARLYVRGYNIFTFAGADQDKVSRPSVVPHLWQTTKHVFKFKGPNVSPNGYFLLADSGRALMIDCGVDKGTLDALLPQMRERLGLKGIDAILITHMHGDHILTAPYVREKWGAQIWSLDRVVEKCEQPQRFDYAALVPAYRADGIESVKFDRSFRAGEKFTWEGYELTVDWMPGQTEFGCCIQGRIDGRRVAFTGDNLFADPDDPEQDGHEAVCARNSAILEEGYIYGAEYLQRLQPDLLLGGHSFVMDHPQGLIDRYRRWALAIRDVYRELSVEDDYRLMFDPYWIRVDPCRVELATGKATELTVHVRNFRSRPQTYRLAFHGPVGLTVEPAAIDLTVPAESTVPVPLRIALAPGVKPGVQIVAIDVTLDGKRYGEWFDFVVGVR
jgi:glyoxylase-like metal-dependent hydrolase (beta-lactamase superfamily II)